MNRLQYETSPYLLQHAHNPVDWYAWKPEAFLKAKEEQKPIIVSIGYSTCHWCHVMERESFEDQEVAQFMNQHFVNIKVDREERPDVDKIYMEACQIINGNGGWPLNCFLLPDGRPYYAGTYYPPKGYQNRPSWMQLIQHMHQVYTEQYTEVLAQADKLTQIIENSAKTFLPGSQLNLKFDDQFSSVHLDQVFNTLKASFDMENGGFGGAPKFPSSMSLHFLLEYHFYTKNENALSQLELSVQKMIYGGIFDQLGGGFARYSVDEKWQVPHFEKMLYDNAQLVSLISDLHKVSPKPMYEKAIKETLEFIEREMTSPEGGFYSALDADSEGEEGKFYVWNKKELEGLLEKREAELFCNVFNVTDTGNWEGTNILWQTQNLEELAKAENITPEKLAVSLANSRKVLFDHRAQRIRPGLDDKILLNWNLLQSISYLNAYKTFGKPSFLKKSHSNHQFILENMLQEDGLHFYHTYKNGDAKYDAYLDDYALYIRYLLELFEIEQDFELIAIAEKYIELVMVEFKDTTSPLFQYNSMDQKDVPVRTVEVYDSSLPSGNSLLFINLIDLYTYTGQKEYLDKALEMGANLKQAVEKYPSTFSNWLRGYNKLSFQKFELAILGTEAKKQLEAFTSRYLPNVTIVTSETPNEDYPLLAKRWQADKTLYYLCKDFTCHLPVEDFSLVIQQIERQNFG